MGASVMAAERRTRRSRYTPPAGFETTTLNELVEFTGRFPASALPPRDLFGGGKSRPERSKNVTLYTVGDRSLLRKPCVSIIGTRDVSPEGARRARKLAGHLVSQGVVILSGLAMGVDTAAQSAAIEHDGKTIAVIGTPLDRCNPSQNSELQEHIYREHLLISQFEWGSQVYPSNFPQRNKVMAALADATVIIEAGDTSGTLHQAVECVHLQRPMFILQSVIDDESLKWPKNFLKYENVKPLQSVDDVFAVLKLDANRSCH